MDTIRSKIYALHGELTTALFSANKAAESADGLTKRAKDLENQQRLLFKKISNNENDLEKALEKLDKVESSVIEKEKATRQAGEDKRTLTLELAQKEQAFRRVNEALETNAAQAKVVQERSDTLEKGRKEIEHRVMSADEAIDKLEQDLRNARFLRDETGQKTVEASYKCEKLSAALSRALDRAAKAEAAQAKLEDRLRKTGTQLSDKIGNREKSSKRTDTCRNQLRKLTDQLQEAENRADVEDEEVAKMERRAELIRNRIQSIREQKIKKK